MFGAGPHHHHGLRRGLHCHQRAVSGHQHVATPHHAAAGQEDGQRAALAVLRVEAAFLARVPVQRQRGGAFHEHRGQATALGDEFVDGQHGRQACGKGGGAVSITFVITEVTP